MVSWRPFPGVATSRRALTVSLVQLSCRRYQPRGVSRALPSRVGRRRSCSLMVACVRWVLWFRGGLAGRAVVVWRVYVAVCMVQGGLGWAGRCRVVSRVRGGWYRGVTGPCGGGGSCGGRSSGARWWFLGGWRTEMGGCAGR